MYLKRFFKKKIVYVKNQTSGLFLFLLIQTLLVGNASAQVKEDPVVTLKVTDATLEQVFKKLSDETGYNFKYANAILNDTRKFTYNFSDKPLSTILTKIAKDAGLEYKVDGENVSIKALDKKKVSGKLTDAETGEPLIGATINVTGTTQGTVTNVDGNYTISVYPNTTLSFSYIGYQSIQSEVAGRTIIDVSLKTTVTDLEEVVVIGYGTMRKSDLTGAVQRADIESFQEQPNVSLMQSLHGSVPGLNVGQVNAAGGEPTISIRGLTTLSGETAPLVVLDGVIFRGNLIDINPNDIESVDILKDASSTAVYGSQAANGVIIITTSKSGGRNGKPLISLSSQYSFQKPYKTFEYPGVEYFQEKTIHSDFYSSMTEESGYLEADPDYSFTSTFNTAYEIWAYENGITVDWYDLVTRDEMHTQSHNISISNNTDYNNYFISLGYSDQLGYMLNEDYERINARINTDNIINNWLTIGIQSFLTTSDYSGDEISPRFRYEHNPYMTVYDENGDYVTYPGGQFINPMLVAEADDLDKRLNISGNVYVNIDFPFIEGLSYRFNFNNTFINRSEYSFQDYGADLRGSGSKTESKNYDYTSDNIISYKRTFNEVHSINATLLYGIEKRNYTSTYAGASDFINTVLGYDRLQAGNAELYDVSSAAWEESSLYQMARLFYGYNNRYLVTGTIRRDGFSGFSKNNKIGIFPSAALAWVISNEPFIQSNINWIDNLKLRMSYGSNGNRTISRYQTLATVTGGYNYVTADESSVYTQSIASLASPNLKWETTTGINLGVDLGVLKGRIFGSIDYYNNNTTNLLYNVDIPAISRYTNFPDNLGKLHNQGIDLMISSINVRRSDFTWKSTFSFSRNRNELKELLGFDNDEDGKEDDLVSEGLFIGEPLSAIYTYKLTGEFWEVGEELPAGFALGSYKIEDISGDGEFTPEDREIIGYEEPAYRFSINNEVSYKNWTLRVFINSIQGGKDYYLGLDDLSSWSLSESVFRRNLPEEIDFWYPGNSDATYHAIPITGKYGDRWVQRSFVRLQDVSLSYNFSNSMLNNLKIQSLKVYASGKNLATWTKWPGWDPETGEPISRDGRPVMSSFTLGLNVEF